MQFRCFRSLFLGLLMGSILMSGAKPSSAVEVGKNQLNSKTAAVKLTNQLEEMATALKSLQGKAGVDSAFLDIQKKRLSDIQKELNQEFVQTEAQLKARYSSTELEVLLERLKDAKERLDGQFTRIYQAMSSQDQAGLSSLQKQIQSLLSINHQALDPEQLPIAALSLAKPQIDISALPQLPVVPLAEDLAVTPDESVKDLAGQLNNDPQQIFQWVYNNVNYRPGYGILQNSESLLQSKQGNAYEQAMLLISLLRSANIPARYAYGEIALTNEQLSNWLGVADPKAAYSLLDQAGIERKGNNVSHVWVKAYLAQEKRWLDFDPSFKQYRITAIPTVEQDKIWLQGLLKFAQPLGTSPLNVLPDQKTVNAYQLIQQTTEIEHHSLSQSSQLPADFIGKLEFNLEGASHTVTLQEIAGQPIAIAYLPAQDVDSNVIKYFGEKSSSLPAYLIKLQSYLLLGNKVIEMGKPVTMGTPQTFSTNLNVAGNTQYPTKHLLFAGMSAAWVGNWGQSLTYVKPVDGLKERFDAHVAESVRKELYLAPLADMVLAYQKQNQRVGEVLAAYSSFYFAPGFSESIAAMAADVNFAFTVPMSFSLRCVQLDVQKDNMLLASRESDKFQNKHFLSLKGVLASALEHVVLQEKGNPVKQQAMEAVSAVKILTLATEQGIPLVSLDQRNFAQEASNLKINSALYNDLQNLVKAGKTVVLPQQMLQLDDWRGIGYIVLDKASGNSAYMLSNGIGGGANVGASAVSTFNVPFPNSTWGKIIMVAMIFIMMLVIAFSA